MPAPAESPEFRLVARPAVGADLDAIVARWLEFMAEMRADGFIETDIDPREVVAKWRERTDYCIAANLVAVLVRESTAADGGDSKTATKAISEAEIVGFSAGLSWELNSLVPRDAVLLTDTFTAPDFRLVRATHDLFGCVRELARAAGKTRLITNTHKNNRRVILIMRRLGFETCEPLEFEVAGHSWWEAQIRR